MPIYADETKISGPTSDAAIAAVTAYPIKALAARISGPTSEAAMAAIIPTTANTQPVLLPPSVLLAPAFHVAPPVAVLKLMVR